MPRRKVKTYNKDTAYNILIAISYFSLAGLRPTLSAIARFTSYDYHTVEDYIENYITDDFTLDKISLLQDCDKNKNPLPYTNEYKPKARKNV